MNISFLAEKIPYSQICGTNVSLTYKKRRHCYLLKGYNENIWNQDDFQIFTTANTTCASEWPGAMLAKVPTIEHNQLVAALLGPSFAGEFPWIGIYNWAYYDYYFSQIDQKQLLFSNWESGKPNHLQSTTQKCVQMNWRSKQNYQDYVKLGMIFML